jgi:hypothetical protein
MTMTITGSDLCRFQRLVSKLMKSSDEPAISLIPHDGNLKLCAFAKDAMLTMLVDTEGSLDPFTMRWSDFKSLTAKKNQSVTFNLTKDSIHVRCGEAQDWFLANRKVNALPNLPSETSTHQKTRLLTALTDAACCVDKDNFRTAVTGICLRGDSSQIISTTGIQLLVQDGFDFTWGDSDVTVPASKIFASKELMAIDTDEVLIGLVAEHAYFGIGEVEFWLRTVDGKFPNVASIMKPAEDTTYLTIDPNDAAFVLDKIKVLPGSKEKDSPIYLSLDVAVWLRSYETAQNCGVALELSRSAFTGKPVSVAMNRQFLRNALSFGIHRIGIDPTGDKPIICDGNDKTFVCMPFSGTEPTAEHMEVIASSLQPAVAPKEPTAPVPVKCKRKVADKSTIATPASKVALLESAEQIRNDLRKSLVQVNTLIREVKVQRRQDRLLQTTMDSLRKLSLA